MKSLFKRLSGWLQMVPLLLLILCCSNIDAQKKPNVLILMTDDTGWGDFGYMSGGGAALGHPTPNIDRMAKEGAIFTSWYGQASCTAGRCFIYYRPNSHPFCTFCCSCSWR